MNEYRLAEQQKLVKITVYANKSNNYVCPTNQTLVTLRTLVDSAVCFIIHILESDRCRTCCHYLSFYCYSRRHSIRANGSKLKAIHRLNRSIKSDGLGLPNVPRLNLIILIIFIFIPSEMLIYLKSFNFNLREASRLISIVRIQLESYK